MTSTQYRREFNRYLNKRTKELDERFGDGTSHPLVLGELGPVVWLTPWHVMIAPWRSGVVGLNCQADGVQFAQLILDAVATEGDVLFINGDTRGTAGHSASVVDGKLTIKLLDTRSHNPQQTPLMTASAAETQLAIAWAQMTLEQNPLPVLTPLQNECVKLLRREVDEQIGSCPHQYPGLRTAELADAVGVPEVEVIKALKPLMKNGGAGDILIMNSFRDYSLGPRSRKRYWEASLMPRGLWFTDQTLQLVSG